MSDNIIGQEAKNNGMDVNNANMDWVDTSNPAKIKVIGVGGGGGNAVTHMYKKNIEGVSYVLCNTDRQALNNSPVPRKVCIGKGLGAGNKPERGKEIAEDEIDKIESIFSDEPEMVFITAGMGGGTGTGAGPVVARVAKDKGILTVGIVTIPFMFEGLRKISKALDGVNEMQKHVDALLIINNERLLDIYPDLDFESGFAVADDTLANAAKGISEIVNKNGHMNCDMEDVDTTLRDGGAAIISTGYAEGEGRVTKALQNALNSPLLKNSEIFGAKHMLINIFYNNEADQEFKIAELNEVKTFMSNFTDLDIITGTAIDSELGNQIKITILASGFNVSLNENSAQQKQVQKSATDDGRIGDVYGKEKITGIKVEEARSRFIILDPADYDNDEQIDNISREATYNRNPKFNAVHVPVAHPQEKAAEKGDKPSTIVF